MIESFDGPNRFLSNFTMAEVALDSVLYPSVEHAYQAAKTLDPGGRMAVRDCPTPGQAKRLGRSLKSRPDWPQVKLAIMEDLLRQKFTRHPGLRDKLLATGDQELVEGNTWGDTFWGVCRGEGTNHLGRLLMKIRSELHD